MSDSEIRSVSSLFENLAEVLEQRAPRSGRAMLGAWWSFGQLPRRGPGLCEYSLPTAYADALAQRTGLQIREHSGAESLDAHIASGDVAIVAVDSFHLTYRPAFGQVHSGRTIQVRDGRSAGEVWITDRWLPAYEGPLDRATLERARRSPVSLDPVREPIFAGRAIDGEWYSVCLTAVPLTNVHDWSTGLLFELVADGTLGVAALGRLRAEIEDESRAKPGDVRQSIPRELWRDASLLLRSELSTRVFLCAFLQAAAGWRDDASLRDAAREYYRALGAMQMARDLLAKSLAHPRPSYAAVVSEQLSLAIAAENKLSEMLATTLRKDNPCATTT